MMIGDALNMRHPLTGGGMTVALTDVQLLGSLLLAVNNFKDQTLVDRAIATFYESRHKSTATIKSRADFVCSIGSASQIGLASAPTSNSQEVGTQSF